MRRLARAAAIFGIGTLGISSMSAASGALPAEGLFSGLASGFTHFSAAFFMLAGAGMAMITLRAVRPREEPAPAAQTSHLSGLNDLLAQMSHELRTPLNAVIGFSDVMRQELYGPIGNARYQEYVHHIAESGGQMLQSSQDALATAETMAALLSRQQQPAQERITAGSLVRDAVTGARLDPARIQILACDPCEILCEQRATAQALGHLLREAAVHSGPDGCITVAGRRQGLQRSITITASAGKGVAARPAAGLGSLLARLLLEAQGATVAISASPDAGWAATVTFRTI